jgi:hypothetical protein
MSRDRLAHHWLFATIGLHLQASDHPISPIANHWSKMRQVGEWQNRRFTLIRVILRRHDKAYNKLFDDNEMNDKTQKAQEICQNRRMHLTYMEVTDVEFHEHVIGYRLDLTASASGVNSINLVTSESCKIASLHWPEATD